MPRNNERRRDPFAGLRNGEPVEDLGLKPKPAILERRPAKGRQTPIRPAEKRRRPRQITVTFSSEEIPRRLRALAERWGMKAPDRQRPNVSALIEYLLLPLLERAERGEIDPPQK